MVETTWAALTQWRKKPLRPDESEIDQPCADVHVSRPFIHHGYQEGTGSGFQSRWWRVLQAKLLWSQVAGPHEGHESQSWHASSSRGKSWRLQALAHAHEWHSLRYRCSAWWGKWEQRSCWTGRWAEPGFGAALRQKQEFLASRSCFRACPGTDEQVEERNDPGEENGMTVPPLEQHYTKRPLVEITAPARSANKKASVPCGKHSHGLVPFINTQMLIKSWS